MSEAPRLLTVSETAQILRCSPKTVRRQIRRGHLLATKPKGLRTLLVLEQSVKDLLNKGVVNGK